MSRPCWCGADALVPYGRGYERCLACETLVLPTELDARADRVVDDERDFYGRHYWLSHQADTLGIANIGGRARTDLAERCLHWLRALLAYRSPPARALELGAAHGGFVAMLRWAGYDAAGLELSPWVAEFARETFGVPMYEGPVDEQAIEAGSLDIVAAFDVVEHLTDPLGTLKRCEHLLAADGLIFLQTPVYPEGATFEELSATGSPFLEHLSAARGHVYLFSQRSLSELLARLGLPHVAFQRAIFAHYDMFLVAGRSELKPLEIDPGYRVLEDHPSARLVRALLDLDDAARGVQASLARCESDVAFLTGQVSTIDRIAAERLEVIEKQGDKLGRISTLEAALEASEADRAARLEVIERQGRELGRIPTLEAELKSSEADRAARLGVIEQQGRELERMRTLEAELAAGRDELSRMRVTVEIARRSRLYRGLRRFGLLTALDLAIPSDREPQ